MAASRMAGQSRAMRAFAIWLRGERMGAAKGHFPGLRGHAGSP